MIQSLYIIRLITWSWSSLKCCSFFGHTLDATRRLHRSVTDYISKVTFPTLLVEMWALPCHQVTTKTTSPSHILFVPQFWRKSCFVIRAAPPAATVAGLVGSGFNNYYSKPPVKTSGETGCAPEALSSSCLVCGARSPLSLVSGSIPGCKITQCVVKNKEATIPVTPAWLFVWSLESSCAAVESVLDFWEAQFAVISMDSYNGLHSHLFTPAVFIVNELSDQLWCFESVCILFKHSCVMMKQCM